MNTAQAPPSPFLWCNRVSVTDKSKYDVLFSKTFVFYSEESSESLRATRAAFRNLTWFTYTFPNEFADRLHDKGGQEAAHVHHQWDGSYELLLGGKNKQKMSA